MPPVNILALDTTLGACSAAVASGDEGVAVTARAFELHTREHAEAIMPMIGQVLRAAGLGYGDLEAVAVTVGPGTFTGVRVGVAAARGLALACDKPLIGATSLEVMARQALGQLGMAPDILGIAVDARRGEVYFGLFDGAGAPRSGPEALTPEMAAARLPEKGRAVLAGSGAQAVLEAAARADKDMEAVLSELQPDAAALAVIARGRAPQATPLSPLYLRPPDAKPQTVNILPRRK